MDGLELVKKFSEDMETMLRRKVEAVKVPLPVPQHWPDDPFRDSTLCRWSSPGWVDSRVCYINQGHHRCQGRHVAQGRGHLQFSARPCRHLGMRSPAHLRAPRNPGGWVPLAEKAREETES